MAQNQEAAPDWFAAVMYRESNMNPTAKNPLGFQGLIQFSRQNLVDWGLTPTQVETFNKRTAAQQMPFIQRFYRSWRPKDGWVSRAQLYQATFMPGTIKWKGSDPSTVLAKKGDPEYDQNPSLQNATGKITVGDLENVIQAHIDQNDSQWNVALAGIDAAGGNLPSAAVAMLEKAGYRTLESPTVVVSEPTSTSGIVAVTLGVALAGIGAYYGYQTFAHAQHHASS